jgi:hypothetical protein
MGKTNSKITPKSFVQIKKSVAEGWRNKAICQRYKIGETTLFRVKRSKNFEAYQDELDELSIKKAEKRAALQKLDDITRNAVYDRKEYPSPYDYEEESMKATLLIAGGAVGLGIGFLALMIWMLVSIF